MIELRIGKSVDASILNHFEPYSLEYEFYYSVVNSSALPTVVHQYYSRRDSIFY